VTEEDSEPVLDTDVDDFASTLEGDFPTLKMVMSPTTWAALSYLSWDLKGPLPASLGGKRYALFGTCRVTRKRFDFYIEFKSEVADIIITIVIATSHSTAWW